MTPTPADDIVWKPHDGSQFDFLASSAREAFFAGEAGSGKSAAMLAAPIRFMQLPGYSALILRRTYPAIRDSLLPKAFALYPRLGGQEHEGGKLWTWEGGGQIRFGSMERAEDRFQFKSAEHEFIGFEELDTFEEIQWVYMFSRNRTSHRLPDGRWYPLRMRANANPGGPGTEWIVRRWGPWIYKPPGPKLDEQGKIVIDKAGNVVTVPDPETPGDFTGPFVKSGTKLWCVTDSRTGARRYVSKDTLGDNGEAAISTVFFVSRKAENLSMDVAAYKASLAQMAPLEREQLDKGNWFARARAGAFFNRTWIQGPNGPGTLDVLAPARVLMRVRVWDRAATEATAENTDPDWTVGALMSMCSDGFIWIEDIVRLRAAPGVVEATIVATAELDAQRRGTPTAVGLLHDPGSAGKFEMASYVKHAVLARNQIIPIQVHKDKVTIGKPFSAAAFNKRVRVVAGPWNQDLMHELERFPEGEHDDQWDAVANGYRVLHGLHGSSESKATGAEAKAAQGMPSMHRTPGGF